MIAELNRMSGPERSAANTPSDHFTHAFREARMQPQSTDARTAKRTRLRELVSRLGQDATPATIREEAYRVGFGAVNALMLTAVRDEVFPARAKKSDTYTRSSNPEVIAVVTCPKCGSMKTGVRQFSRDGAEFVRKHNCCGCGESYITRSTIRLAARQSNHEAAKNATEKACNKCGRLLPVSNFSNRAVGSVLYRPTCKECTNRLSAIFQFKKRLARHGLTMEQYEAVLAEQGGTCAICKQPGNVYDRWHPLNFDHCHKSEKFRGLLCDRCNMGIGSFDDDIDRFRAVIEYLTKHLPPEASDGN